MVKKYSNDSFSGGLILLLIIFTAIGVICFFEVKDFLKDRNEKEEAIKQAFTDGVCFAVAKFAEGKMLKPPDLEGVEFVRFSGCIFVNTVEYVNKNEGFFINASGDFTEITHSSFIGEGIPIDFSPWYEGFDTGEVLETAMDLKNITLPKPELE